MKNIHQCENESNFDARDYGINEKKIFNSISGRQFTGI